MKYKDKTKEQRINESAGLHQRVEDFEAKETKKAEFVSIDNVYPVDHKRSIFIWDNNR